jgi:hypothetical protein
MNQTAKVILIPTTSESNTAITTVQDNPRLEYVKPNLELHKNYNFIIGGGGSI